MPKPALPSDLLAGRRRSRIRYGVAVAVAVLAAAVTVTVVVGTGEAANASLVTGTAAPAVPGGTIRPAPTPVWRSDDRAASGTPLWVGTVVTWSEHRLAGRDATSGDVRWSYTRDDLSICDAAQRDGRAFVLFGRDGDCDELSTFDTQTGARGWFRTLPDDGEGRLAFGATGLVVTYAASFHAMTATTGIDRFPTVPVTGTDCRFTAVVPGTAGILVSERCTDGGHLALWGNDGADGKAQQLWRVPVDDAVTAVAAPTAAALAYDPVTGTLGRYATQDGAVQDPLTLQPATSGPAGSTTVSGDDLLLDLGDRVYAVGNAGAIAWSAAATGPPSVTDASGTSVVVPTAGGADLLDGFDGTVQASYTLPSSFPAATGDQPRRVAAAGAGLLVSGPGIAYLR